ncbi:unnamed protein product, partial [Clonostachys rhizophaga]
DNKNYYPSLSYSKEELELYILVYSTSLVLLYNLFIKANTKIPAFDWELYIGGYSPGSYSNNRSQTQRAEGLYRTQRSPASNNYTREEEERNRQHNIYLPGHWEITTEYTLG